MRRRLCGFRLPLLLSAQSLWFYTSYSGDLHIHCDDPLNSSSSSSEESKEGSSSSKAPPHKINVRSPSSCRNVACNDHMSLLRRSINAHLDAAVPSETDNVIAPNMNEDVPPEVKHQSGIPAVYSGCPVDRSQLGRSSWDLLHTMAANYPDDPSPETQRLLLNFFEALAHLYPCTYCAEDFQELMKTSPPRFLTSTLCCGCTHFSLTCCFSVCVTLGWSPGRLAVFGCARHTMM